MEDREFFDGLYSAWAKTTAAEHGGWMVEKIGDSYTVMARDPSGSVVLADLILEENDAEFIAGIHGVLPDLVRRLNDALDEAERLDIEKDELHGRIMDLEQETEALEIKAQEAYEIGHGKGYNEGYEEALVMSR